MPRTTPKVAPVPQCMAQFLAGDFLLGLRSPMRRDSVRAGTYESGRWVNRCSIFSPNVITAVPATPPMKPRLMARQTVSTTIRVAPASASGHLRLRMLEDVTAVAGAHGARLKADSRQLRNLPVRLSQFETILKITLIRMVRTMDSRRDVMRQPGPQPTTANRLPRHIRNVYLELAIASPRKIPMIRPMPPAATAAAVPA